MSIIKISALQKCNKLSEKSIFNAIHNSIVLICDKKPFFFKFTQEENQMFCVGTSAGDMRTHQICVPKCKM